MKSLSSKTASNLPLSIPFHLSIKRISSPFKSLPFPSSNLQKKCAQTKIPTFFSLISSSHLTNSLKIQSFSPKIPSFFDLSATGTEEMSSKINMESVIVSIDDFFIRYPFFVASLAFIWLVVIPLTKEYLNKYKFISCIDAFRKLRDDPSSQMLDIRKKQSLAYLKTPNLKIFSKESVNLEFVEGCEEEFVKEILKRFPEPENTILCVLDILDGNSLKVAKLLFENGFKEAYAIQGGLLGKDGWKAIQETLLPPSVHVYPKKKIRKRSPDQDDEKDKGIEEHEENRELVTSSSSSSMNQKAIENVENGCFMTEKSSSPAEEDIHGSRPLSPYPNFKDLKPPSSPTPSKPK